MPSDPSPQMPAFDGIVTALTSPDPLQRYRAAGAASAYFNSLQADALQELVAAHDGNRSAAAREIEVTPEAVRKRLASREARTTGEAPEQSQPALRFPDREEAESELLRWAQAAQQVQDRRDPLVHGALAVGVGPETIWRLTGITAEVISRLTPAGPIEVGAELDPDVLAASGKALHAYAQALAATPGTSDMACTTWRREVGSFIDNCAPDALLPGGLWESAEEAMQFAAEASLKQDPLADGGPDVWLAAKIAELRRRAAEARAHAEGVPHGALLRMMARVQDAIADVYLHLRTYAALPTLPDLAEWSL